MQPILDRWLYLQDTCGVHNLHGLPGVFSGLASALAASAAEEMGGRNKAAYGNRWNAFEDHTMLLDQDNEWGWDDCIYINLWSGYGAYVCNLIYALYFQLCLLVDTKLWERWTMSTCWWLLFKTLVCSFYVKQLSAGPESAALHWYNHLGLCKTWNIYDFHLLGSPLVASVPIFSCIISLLCQAKLSI